MPFTIFKSTKGWKIKKPSTGKVYKQTFKSKESAYNMAKRWMEYRNEKPNIKVSGGWFMPNKKEINPRIALNQTTKNVKGHL